jgi:hypothetical protein
MPRRREEEVPEIVPYLSETKRSILASQESDRRKYERRDRRLRNKSQGATVAPNSLGGDEKTSPLSTDSQ